MRLLLFVPSKSKVDQPLDTFLSFFTVSSQLPAVRDDHFFLGDIICSDWILFDGIEHGEAVNNLAENAMCAIEVGSVDETKEEL